MTERKFKVGDKVRIIECSFTNSDIHEGKTGTIVHIFKSGAYEVDYGIEGDNCVANRVELIKNGKKVKELPVQFVVTFDENGRDPVAVFTSKKEMKKWLTKAKDNSEIVFGSIRIFEVKKEYAVKMNFTLKKLK
jgi:ribosomal protein L21E